MAFAAIKGCIALLVTLLTKSSDPSSTSLAAMSYCNTGALIIRIGFWGPLYYNYTKEPPK